eukprot:CAMPEP_0204364618 /NCGR_PEP_ID=MMETSP0469-20131031/41282_1 /ASSEMBLY_ACC=CAM_ASM_000384 /TAXON_ID=2969 /ORGANISM="Oxyrrhis marina" /LENGTH=30 /DNA_ID= /DNA_START= /DNA_END= /DNA_ORIENTATION=
MKHPPGLAQRWVPGSAQACTCDQQVISLAL